MSVIFPESLSPASRPISGIVWRDLRPNQIVSPNLLFWAISADGSASQVAMCVDCHLECGVGSSAGISSEWKNGRQSLDCYF